MLKKYTTIDAQLFIDNRKRLTQLLKSNAIVIVTSNDEAPRSADGYHAFRQNSDLFYLTGIDQENTVLVLFPDHPKEEMRELLFVRKTNKHIAVWEGHKYTQAEATQASGIAHVVWTDELPSILPSLMYMAENCYLNTNEHVRMRTSVPDHDMRFAAQMVARYPLHHFQRLAPLMHQLRSIKSAAEIDLLRTAVGITRKAFDRVLRFVQPGVTEYEIEAEIWHEYIRNRATGPAYNSIIASGKNACILHYNANNQVCNSGDLILMDFGAEYANYAADLSRTIPVNGKFNARQRDVYEATLRVMQAAKNLLRPGVLLDDYHQAVGKLMEQEMVGLGLLKQSDIDQQDPKRPVYKKYFMHGTSHFLGLDVHDVGFAHRPIMAGMVFTCEPGIYIPEEGIGIRIENDIVVSQDGANIDLMEDFPTTVYEIESMMLQR